MDKKTEEILIAKYPPRKNQIVNKKELLNNSQIKEVYTDEEFKKRSDKVLKRKLP